MIKPNYQFEKRQKELEKKKKKAEKAAEKSERKHLNTDLPESTQTHSEPDSV